MPNYDCPILALLLPFIFTPKRDQQNLDCQEVVRSLRFLTDMNYKANPRLVGGILFSTTANLHNFYRLPGQHVFFNTDIRLRTPMKTIHIDQPFKGT